jgi:hypothetical protein
VHEKTGNLDLRQLQFEVKSKLEGGCQLGLATCLEVSDSGGERLILAQVFRRTTEEIIREEHDVHSG